MTATPAPSIVQVVLRLDPGGTERLVIELTRRLRSRYQMSVCCLDEPGGWASELTSLGIEVTALHRAPGFHPGLAWRLGRLARARGARVLHCHHYSPFVYGRLAALATRGLRIVFTEHGRLSDAPPSRKRRLATRGLAAGVRPLFAVSHDLRRHLVAEGFPPRMDVIWNGIDAGAAPAADARTHARAQLALPENARVVGTVARLDSVKDLPTVLEACAIARREGVAAHLVVVGDGPERQALHEKARTLDLDGSVSWLGRRDDARALVPAFDVYVNSSISEGISLTLLEAMAAELPVVATRVGGTPEVVVHDGTGMLVDARSPAPMAAAITGLLADPRRAAALGREGRRRVLEHFTIEGMVERYAAIYEQEA
jgi:glycosyltransferase involved in cell wall biosynthesis